MSVEGFLWAELQHLEAGLRAQGEGLARALRAEWAAVRNELLAA